MPPPSLKLLSRYTGRSDFTQAGVTLHARPQRPGGQSGSCWVAPPESESPKEASVPERDNSQFKNHFFANLRSTTTLDTPRNFYCDTPRLSFVKQLVLVKIVQRDLVQKVFLFLSDLCCDLCGTCRFKNNCFTEIRSGAEEGSHLRLMDGCITQL